jgi:hypothetical protein
VTVTATPPQPADCDVRLLIHNDKVVRHALKLVMDDYYLEEGRAGARRYLAHHYRAMNPGECGVG